MQTFATATVLALALSLPTGALGQAYPVKPVRLVVGFAPGGVAGSGDPGVRCSSFTRRSTDYRGQVGVA